MGRPASVFQISELLTLLRECDDKLAIIDEIKAAAEHGTKDLDIVRRRVLDKRGGRAWAGSTHPRRQEHARQHAPPDGLSDEENAEADRLRKMHGGQ